MSAAEMIRKYKSIILVLGSQGGGIEISGKLNMDQQISIIKQKLKELKRKDPAFQIFGASSHR